MALEVGDDVKSGDKPLLWRKRSAAEFLPEILADIAMNQDECHRRRVEQSGPTPVTSFFEISPWRAARSSAMLDLAEDDFLYRNIRSALLEVELRRRRHYRRGGRR